VPYNCTTGQRPVEIGVADNYKYKAFISYSHSDEKWAAWLHRALETYKVPKHIVGETTECGTVPERLAPVFRDREELATSTSLGDTLTQALRDSACQIVICSPRAAKSRWTNEEILTFKRLGRSNRIYCLIVDGEPGASDHPETADEECFPPALRYEMGEDGELTDIRSEPIAADARKGKDPKPLAKLKLIAGMLGVGFDDLRQREAQRRHRRMMVLTTAAFVGMAITSGLAVTAYLARIEAEEQRRIAEVEAETARQTTDFMVGLFEVSDPSEALGNTITAREILDQGAERIENELTDQPEIQATLMATMGTVYTSLGLYEPAVSLLENSLETRRRVFGERDPEVADSMDELGKVLGLKGDFDQAHALYRAAYELKQSADGGDGLELATSLSGMADMLFEQGEYWQAESLYEQVLAIQREYLEEPHADIAMSMQNLGLVNFEQGEYELAESQLRAAVEAQRELHGDIHPELAAAMGVLATGLVEMDRLDEAEEIYREILAMSIRLYGDVHPNVAHALHSVAYTVHSNGDLESAEALYRQAIDMQRESVGETHPELADYLSNLAFLLYQKGDIEPAAATAQEALDLRREVLGPRHPKVADSAATLAFWSIQRGDFEEAEKLLDESLAIRRELLGDEHPDVGSSMTLQAEVYLETGRYEQARDTAQSAKNILAAKLAEDHWRVALAENIQGAALANLGNYEEAERLLLSSFEVLAEVPIPGIAEQSRERLEELYTAWGKDTEAIKFAASKD
jgi:tetratricopeptide (TPR) repeat protein